MWLGSCEPCDKIFSRLKVGPPWALILVNHLVPEPYFRLNALNEQHSKRAWGDVASVWMVMCENPAKSTGSLNALALPPAGVAKLFDGWNNPPLLALDKSGNGEFKLISIFQHSYQRARLQPGVDILGAESHMVGMY